MYKTYKCLCISTWSESKMNLDISAKFISIILVYSWAEDETELRAFSLLPLLSLSLFFFSKICIIEVNLLKYYFKRHLIYKWLYYVKTIFNELNIMVSYVDMIGLCHTVLQFYEKSLWCGLNVKGCGCSSISPSKKKRKSSNDDKKMHLVPFHQS